MICGIVLLTAVGKTDLKILIRKEDQLACAEVDGGIRELHEQLLNGDVQCLLQVTASLPLEESYKYKVDWKEGSFHNLPSGYDIVREDNRYVFIPVKLASVVRSLREKNKSVVACVVFATHRNDPSKFKNEPVSAGMLIARWLAEEFRLEPGRSPEDIGIGKSGWINYLDGDMLACGKGRDYPVNREGVCRIDRAIKTLARPEYWACLSVGGGLPEMKEPIKACAQFHFRNRVHIWQDPEFKEDKDWILPTQIPPSPTESFRIRHYALEMIRRGDFTGAYALASPLENDPVERQWVRKIKSAHKYLTGILTASSGLPFSLSRLIEPSNPRCLSCALRVESSLQTGRIPEAISWTCTFFDAALIDFIVKTLKPDSIDDLRKVITIAAGVRLDKRLIEKIDNSIYGCLNRIREGQYEYRIGGNYTRRWLEVIQSKSLTQFRKAIDPYKGKQVHMSPLKLRNILMHSRVTQEYMAEAKSVFISQGLWASKEKTMNGFKFLKQILVQNLFTELGIDHVENYWNTFIEDLSNELKNYTIQ